MASSPVVAVIGGGIGGLAAAHALLRHGIEVTVHEQAAQLGEVGAGVQIAPNALRLLRRAGLGSAVEDVAVRFREGSSYFRADGTPISSSVIADSAQQEGVYGIHRADFVSLLADSLPADVVHTGHKAVSFSQTDESATVEFENGDSVTADVIVGADGIHSVLRPYVTELVQPVYSGSVAYRGLVSADRMPSWRNDIWQMWLGSHKHFLVFPVRRGQLLNYVGFVPQSEETLESWTAPGDPNQLRAAFEGWDSRLLAFLEQVESTFWWGLRDRDPITTWTNGRLALLGDAAHPMLPHLGQGANQSVEDGVTLAVLLERGGKEHFADALRGYEQLRKERAAAVQTGSRANGMRYDTLSGTVEERDAEIAESMSFRWSLYDYDAEAAAEVLPLG